MRKNNRKKDILKAARRLARKKGVMAVSIDAVAKEAKLSKGGVLYHFPSKDLMIRELIEDWRDSFRTRLKEHRSKILEPGSWCRSYIMATLESYKPSRIRLGRYGAALYVASAFSPKLLAPVRDELRVIDKNIEMDGVDPVVGTIVRLVMDGFWLNEIFGLNVLTIERKNQIILYLNKMISGATNQTSSCANSLCTLMSDEDGGHAAEIEPNSKLVPGSDTLSAHRPMERSTQGEDSHCS